MITAKVAKNTGCENKGPFVQRLTKQCAWCGAVLIEGGPEVTHGICPVCAQVFYLQFRPALMKPKATRWDCNHCRVADLDSDGVADGCRVEECIRADRRSPWRNNDAR